MKGLSALLTLIFFALFICAICTEISFIEKAIKEDAKECIFSGDTAMCLELHRQTKKVLKNQQ